MATSRSSTVSLARYTSPMPPAPSRRADSVGPERAAGEHGNLVGDKAGGDRKRRLVEKGIAARRLRRAVTRPRRADPDRRRTPERETTPDPPRRAAPPRDKAARCATSGQHPSREFPSQLPAQPRLRQPPVAMHGFGRDVSAAAVSSTLNPPKNRSSTTSLLRWSNCDKACSARSSATRSGSEPRSITTAIASSSGARTLAPRALCGILAPRDIHENAAHQTSGHREEVGAVLPVDTGHADEPQVRFVDERRRLQLCPARSAAMQWRASRCSSRCTSGTS